MTEQTQTINAVVTLLIMFSFVGMLNPRAGFAAMFAGGFMWLYLASHP